MPPAAPCSGAAGYPPPLTLAPPGRVSDVVVVEVVVVEAVAAVVALDEPLRVDREPSGVGGRSAGRFDDAVIAARWWRRAAT